VLVPVRTSDEPAHLAFRRHRVLVADHSESETALISHILAAEGYAVDTATDGSAVLDAVRHRPPDVLLVDVDLPGQSGLEVCRRVRQNAATRLLPIILMSAPDARDERIEGLEAGADDVLLRPLDVRELIARSRSLLRMKQYTDDLDSASAILTTLSTMIESRNGNAAGHCTRMANYATALGRALGIGEDDLHVLYRGAFLHDVGMLAISDFVLCKPGPLEADEYALVKSHTVLGDELCANLRSLQPIRPIVRWHHERLDGSGYPDGLRGDAIPLLAQIVGVVDVYEAVTTERPYQRRRSPQEAVDTLREEVASGWRSGDLVEAFVRVLQERAHLP
jgi:putative two-component system response regulator